MLIYPMWGVWNERKIVILQNKALASHEIAVLIWDKISPNFYPLQGVPDPPAVVIDLEVITLKLLFCL